MTAAALLALWNDVDPALEAAYNDWHAREHVPERCTVPGILWGWRYRRVGDDPVMPRYLTLYGLRDAAVLDSEPYQRLLREPTPASRAMRPALRHISRWVCRIHTNAVGEASRLLAVQVAPTRQALDTATPAAAHRLLAERLSDAAGLPWLGAGQASGIEGGWLACSAFELPPLRPPPGAVPYARLDGG